MLFFTVKLRVDLLGNFLQYMFGRIFAAPNPVERGARHIRPFLVVGIKRRVMSVLHVPNQEPFGFGPLVVQEGGQIGRASCRERVSLNV